MSGPVKKAVERALLRLPEGQLAIVQWRKDRTWIGGPTNIDCVGPAIKRVLCVGRNPWHALALAEDTGLDDHSCGFVWRREGGALYASCREVLRNSI